MKKYIFTHMGLGDYLTCNGLIREYAKVFDVVIFVKKHYFESIKFLFRDLKNIELIEGDIDFVRNYLRIIPEEQVLRLGEHGKNWGRYLNYFDEVFYRQANIDHCKKWDSFYIQRDINREIELYNRMIKNKDFIFIQDDPTRGFFIRDQYKTRDYFTPSPLLTPNIFDNLYIMEQAKEIHLMSSSLICIVDFLNIPESKLYLHRYVRPQYTNWDIASNRKNWKEIY